MTSLTTINTNSATPFNGSVTTANNLPTMTSLEIVEFINSYRQATATFDKPYIELQHRSFMAKVPQVLGESNAANYFASQAYGNNNTRSIYNFPKREACLMAMSYSYELQAEIYDRMTAMEQQILMLNRPSYMIEDPVERAKKWIEETTAKQEVETKLIEATQVIQEQQVDVDALERIASRKGSMTMRDAAKLLNMRPMDLRDWMKANKWTYEPYNGKYRPSAAHATAGHLTLSANEYDPLVRVTWKGLALLAKRLNVVLDSNI